MKRLSPSIALPRIAQFLPLVLLLCLVLASCTGSKKRSRVTGDMTKPGPKQAFGSPAGNFILRPPAEMRRMGKDSVPWSAYMPGGEKNGVVVYFFGQGASIALASPHIRVEYISRSLPGSETPEKLFEWLKEVFVESDYHGMVISEGKTITTASGSAAPWLEISIPETPSPDDPETRRAAKSMLWAYIPLGEEYLVGVNATAVFPEDYRELKQAFMTTVASFQK